jgi:uncharacterized membrane protein YvlD (DUF360 family)
VGLEVGHVLFLCLGRFQLYVNALKFQLDHALLQEELIQLALVGELVLCAFF